MAFTNELDNKIFNSNKLVAASIEANSAFIIFLFMDETLRSAFLFYSDNFVALYLNILISYLSMCSASIRIK